VLSEGDVGVTNMSKQLGWIFLVSGLESHLVHNVRAAASRAGIPEEYVKEIRDFNAVKRAIRQLVDQGIAENLIEDSGESILRDKIKETDEKMSFQLSGRWLEKNGIRYERECVITFHKDSGKLECDHREIKRALQGLLEQARLTCSTTDIHKVVYKLCDANFKRLMLKDGVYFCAKQHKATLDKVKTFYKHLGGRFWCQPIGHDDDDEKNLAETIIDDMKEHVFELKKKMDELKKNEKRKGITPLIAKNAMEDLRMAVIQYRDLADSIRINADKLFREAGQAGEVLAMAENSSQALIMMAKKGRTVAPFLHELAKAAEAEAPEVIIQRPQRPVVKISNAKGDRRVGKRIIPVVPHRRGAAV